MFVQKDFCSNANYILPCMLIDIYSYIWWRQLQRAVGLDNLLYTADADFSCFSDLALSSPADYYIEGQGSLIQ
jgi:hypothetical protein